MQAFAQTAEAIAATTKKLEKVRLLADYFRSRSVEESAISAVFFSGRPFPAYEETTLQVGGRLLWHVVAELSGQSGDALSAAYRRYGDLGAAAFDVLSVPVFSPAAAFARPTHDVPQSSPEREGAKDQNANLSDSSGSSSSSAVQARITVLEAAHAFRAIAAARGVAAKAHSLRDLLSRATPLEAKYLIKIMTGELRIGLKESLVEEAIAVAYGDPVRQVQRANMMLGDIGQTLRLAAEHRLSEARMRLLHPIGFMLASPVETSTEAFEFFHYAQIEDKYDGIRAQAHVAHGDVRLFSRTFDEISESFPELLDPLAAFPDVIFDGEILAWDFTGENFGRALPFTALQQRLGRKRPTAKIQRDFPVAYVVFDVLYARGDLVIDRPLQERTKLLNELFLSPQFLQAGIKRTRKLRPYEDHQHKFDFDAPPESADDAQLVQDRSSVYPLMRSSDLSSDHPSMQSSAHKSLIIRAPVLHADSPRHLAEMFDSAQARGNEGLMIKDMQSPYTPGRRGKSWLKLKRELATLDVVVTAVEPGHGKRAGILSDYTFAVRDKSSEWGTVPRPTPVSTETSSTLPRTPSGEPLLNIGKAYTGLTDAEILKMSEWFEQHTVQDDGWVRQVEPKIVIEVAFNAIMRGDRHNSGYALRFPRIVRLRPDKSPDEADTLDRVREIYERQRELPQTA